MSSSLFDTYYPVWTVETVWPTEPQLPQSTHRYPFLSRTVLRQNNLPWGTFSIIFNLIQYLFIHPALMILSIGMKEIYTSRLHGIRTQTSAWIRSSVRVNQHTSLCWRFEPLDHATPYIIYLGYRPGARPVGRPKVKITEVAQTLKRGQGDWNNGRFTTFHVQPACQCIIVNTLKLPLFLCYKPHLCIKPMCGILLPKNLNFINLSL